MIRLHPLLLLPLIFGVLSIESCTASSASPESNSNFSRHVVLIGFDGWRSSSYEEAEMPFLKEKVSSGSFTLNKRSILPTSSACNWSSMFKGVGPEAHGYIAWNTQSPAFKPTDQNEKGDFPSIFSILKDKHPDSEIGYLYQWNGMKYLVNPKDITFQKAFAVSDKGSKELISAAKDLILNSKPTLAVFIWDFPDHIGHAQGWESDAYINYLSFLDSCIETIFSSCEKAGIINETLFIITSDHGGHGKTHGTVEMSDLETPLFIFGPNINKGPILSPVMQYDVAAIIADYLFLKHPSSWRGKTPESLFL